jgi:hypothetical protein
MQSRQKVQSILPTLLGWKSHSSQPRATAGLAFSIGRFIDRGRMQSFVRHVAHVAGSRTLISSGEISEAKKLNCPTGDVLQTRRHEDRVNSGHDRK